jgi:hypothetical protein
MKIDKTKTEVLHQLVRKDILENQALDVLDALEELGIIEFKTAEPSRIGAIVTTRTSPVGHMGESWTRWTEMPTCPTPWIGARSGERHSWHELEDLDVVKVTSTGRSDS